MNKAARQAKRVAIAIAGTIVVLVGIIAIPYPGPGWLIVFAGLAILASEFEWAQRILDKVKGYYDDLVDQMKQQPWGVRLASLALTGVIVVVTVWLVNGFGLVNDWLQLGIDWLRSPFVR